MRSQVTRRYRQFFYSQDHVNAYVHPDKRFQEKTLTDSTHFFLDCNLKRVRRNTEALIFKGLPGAWLFMIKLGLKPLPLLLDPLF